MIKIWGRNTSSNVQKVMWAVGELKLEHERIDVGGAFGKNKEPPYLAMNPNGAGADAGRGRRLPAVGVQFDRALSRRQARQEPACSSRAMQAARTGQPMDGLATLRRGPGDHAGVLGPDPHAAGEARPCRDQCRQGQDASPRCRSSTRSWQDAYVAGDAFSYGDIPVGIMAYRFVQLVPERPKMPNLDRWYAAISGRQAFKDHVGSIPLT